MSPVDGSKGPVVPFFDANAHPDMELEGCGYEAYVMDAERAGLVGACAVALPETDPAVHMARCREAGLFTPVAPWKSTGRRRLRRSLLELVNLGYRALKVHPRLGGPSIGSSEFRQLAKIAEQFSFTIFLCTYPFGNAKQGLGDQLLSDLERVVREAPTLRLVLLHSGGVDLMRYIEFSRANDHLLLDLSLTLLKYQESSIDNDLSFAFHHFDRRICVGTDYPYYSIRQVASRLEHFVHDLPTEKRDNVLSNNLKSYLADG